MQRREIQAGAYQAGRRDDGRFSQGESGAEAGRLGKKGVEAGPDGSGKKREIRSDGKERLHGYSGDGKYFWVRYVFTASRSAAFSTRS